MNSKVYISISLSTLLIFGCSPNEKPSKVSAQKSQTSEIDELPSWKPGNTKNDILEFIETTTQEGSTDFIPVSDRIAVFDNDGTLWSEQPMYFQLFYIFDRVKELAPEHPEWKNKEPFMHVLSGEHEKALAGGTQALLKLVEATSGNITTDENQKNIEKWISSQTHPKTGLYFNEMIYQPMLELIELLKKHEYKVFIVSGGGMDFIRAWAEETYGIPPYQVVGTYSKVKYEIIEGTPQLIKQPGVEFIDDKEGKPVGIHQNIGKRPIIAVGNSDGDYQMLDWITSNTEYRRFGLILHHTDSIREWAYDSNSHIGNLKQGLIDAPDKGWTVIDMAKDWNSIYPTH